MLAFLLEANSFLVGTILYTFCVGIVFVGRGYFEGRMYNIALSSYIGDTFLIAIVLIAKGILERDKTSLLNLNWLISIGLSLLVGILVNWTVPAKQMMDIYHNLVVIPLLFWLVVFVSSQPIVFHGSTMEKIGAAMCLVMWLVLAAYDWSSGRIDQRAWLGPDFFR